MSKWITFEVIEEKPKTKVWGVFTKDGGVELGTIKWFPQWRKYSFFPAEQTVFETQCLNDIAQFLFTATENHKKVSV